MTTTEHDIQNILWRRWRHLGGVVIIPNYTPAQWFECDIMYLTVAQYMREYEIKLTVADFRADFMKGANGQDHHRYVGGLWTKQPYLSKHQRLANGDPKGPKQFWYVTPEGLVSQDDIPDYAGLWWVTDQPHRRIQEVRAAPVLHKAKVEDKVIRHALGVCYWRMWHERLRADRLTANTP